MPDSAKTDSSLAGVPKTVAPALTPPPQIIERRHLARREALRHRICDEFLEMPGTSLTLSQATRLFGLRGDICARIFGELVRDGHLTLSVDSRYRLHTAA